MSTSFGQIVTWNVRNAFVSKETLANNLEQAGVKVSIPARGKGEYLHRALKQAVTDQLIRKVGEDDTSICFAVVHETTNLKAARWQGEANIVVTLDKKSGNITASGASQLVQQITDATVRGEGGLISHEMGAILKALCVNELNGMSMRDTGGVYFVPASEIKKLDAIEDAISRSLNAGAECKIQRLGVMAGVREAADLASAHAEAVEAEIDTLKAEVTLLVKDIVNAKPSTFTKRVMRLKEIRKQVEMYAQTLGVAATETLQKIERTSQLIERMGHICVKKRALARKAGTTQAAE